jgi:hypothetical protein
MPRSGRSARKVVACSTCTRSTAKDIGELIARECTPSRAENIEFTEGGVRLARGLSFAPRPSAPRRRRPAIAKPDTASQVRISKRTGKPVRAYRRRS